MIKDNIYFHNVEEITKDGKLLRFNEKLINNLGCDTHQRGRFYGYRAIGSELRFKTDAGFFDITLLSYKESSRVYVFYGDYMDKAYTLKEGVISTLHIEIPEKIYLNYDVLPKKNFNPRVIRIIIGYPGYVSYLGLNAFSHKIELPNEYDMPKKKLLIYGSSISHGSEALEYINSYAFILSRMLGIDVLNKSIPGSCQAEIGMTDYLSQIKCDAAFIEFGVNVLQLYNKEMYKEHLDYLLSKIKVKKYLTSVLDNGSILNLNSTELTHLNEFRQYARLLNNVVYINERDLLPEFSSLTADLLHPSDFGQMQIALGLAKNIEI